MLKSMTGFGSASDSFRSERGELELIVELKTLNSRFLDISLRSPRGYSALEQKIQKKLREKLKRGRVELYITRRVLEGFSSVPRVNRDQVSALVKSYEDAIEASGLQLDIQLQDLLVFPEWIESPEASLDIEQEWSCLQKVLDRALSAVSESREQEGRSLQKTLSQFVKQMADHLPQISEKNLVSQKAFKDRLKQKILELSEDRSFDPERLEQEVSIWVAKSDYQEEIDRLSHHLDSMQSLCESSSEAGRRFDFLIQEVHRELNTLGSKAVEAPITHQVIEMKSILEKLREQVQNIE